MHATDTIDLDHVKSTTKMILAVNDRIYRDFNIFVCLDGFGDFCDAVNRVIDSDPCELREINKASLLWYAYLSEMSGLIETYAGQYKNIADIYAYLDSIAVKDSDTFQLVAPKYKINTTNLPAAINVLAEKTRDIGELNKGVKILLSRLESYKKYALMSYYKTSALIQSSLKRERNAAF